MIGNVTNLAIHYMDSLTLVNWMLWRWDLDPQAKLVVICKKGDAIDLINRVRVALAKTKSSMQAAGIKNYRRFGITTTPGDWTMFDSDGKHIERSVVYITRFVEKSHVMSEVYHSMDFGLFQKAK